MYFHKEEAHGRSTSLGKDGRRHVVVAAAGLAARPGRAGRRRARRACGPDGPEGTDGGEGALGGGVHQRVEAVDGARRVPVKVVALQRRLLRLRGGDEHGRRGVLEHRVLGDRDRATCADRAVSCEFGGRRVRNAAAAGAVAVGAKAAAVAAAAGRGVAAHRPS